MAVAPTENEARVLLRGVSWATDETILVDVDAPGARLIYDRGDLEIMSFRARVREWRPEAGGPSETAGPV
jgi:hypothetical protein